jgi:hypothetical protein
VIPIESTFNGLNRTAPDALQVRCEAPSGKLRPMGLGKPTVALVEGSLQVTVALSGNASAWPGVVVEVKAAAGDAHYEEAKTVGARDTEIAVGLKIPAKATQVEVSARVASAPDLSGNSVPATKMTVSLEPKLSGDLSTGKAHAAEIGDYWVIWCETAGIHSPKGGNVRTDFADGEREDPGTPSAPVSSAPKSPRFVFEITPNDPTKVGTKKTTLQATVEYYVPGSSHKFGYATHGQILAARIPCARLDHDKTYRVHIKCLDHVGGKPGPSANGEFHTKPLPEDESP